jgi:hypothetical protein
VNMPLVRRLASRSLCLLLLFLLVLPIGGPAAADQYGPLHPCPEPGPCCFYYCSPGGGGSPTCWCYYTTWCRWENGEYICTQEIYCGAGCIP